MNKKSFKYIIALLFIAICVGVIGFPNYLIHVSPVEDTHYMSNVAQVSAGSETPCVLISTNNQYGEGARGYVQCWGGNLRGALGSNAEGVRLSPNPMTVVKEDGSILSNVRRIEASFTGAAACAVVDEEGNDSLYCWGNNKNALIPTGDVKSRYAAVKINFILQNGTALEESGKKIISLSLGENHGCALIDDGTPYCWGSNNRGEVGDGTLDLKLAPTLVNTDVKFIEIATTSRDEGTTCGLSEDGEIYCWGSRLFGMLLDPYCDVAKPAFCKTQGLNEIYTNKVTKLEKLGNDNEHLFSSHYKFVVYKTNGDVETWGSSVHKDSSGIPATKVLEVGKVSNLRSLALCSDTNIRVLESDGSVHVNNTQITYFGTETDETIVYVTCSAGNHTYYALTDTGNLYAWGNNNNGEVANGDFALYNRPVEVPYLAKENLTPNPLGIRAGKYSTTVINTNGTAIMFGHTLGVSYQKPYIYARYDEKTPITNIEDAASGVTSCFLFTDNGQTRIGCQGGDPFPHKNDNGDVVYLDSRYIKPLSNVDGDDIIADSDRDLTISVKGDCIITDSNLGLVACYGSNAYGQVGDHRYGLKGIRDPENPEVYLSADRTSDRLTYVLDEDGNPFSGAKKVVKGSSMSCALMADETVKCWGNYMASEFNMGIGGETVGSLSPKYVVDIDGNPIKDIVQVDAFIAACALDKSGHVWCWGKEHRGNEDSGKNYASLVLNEKDGDPLSNVKQISVAKRHACAIVVDTDGQNVVKCWGYNNYGQLGNNSNERETKIYPVTVAGYSESKLIKVSSIACGNDHSCAVANDKLYCWGTGLHGENGNANYYVDIPHKIVSNYVLSGVVTNGDEPLKDVEIVLEIDGKVLTKTTDANGFYMFSLFYGQEYKVWAQKDGAAFNVVGTDQMELSGSIEQDTEVNFFQVISCEQGGTPGVNCVTCSNDSECPVDYHCENNGTVRSSCVRDPLPCSNRENFSFVYDSDLDAVVDNKTECTAGSGVCEQHGYYYCDGHSPNSNVVCDAEPISSLKEDELCGDELDNDCDGETDEAECKSTETPTPTATPTVEETPTPEVTATSTVEETPTSEVTATPTVEETPTPEVTATPTAEETPTPEVTATPTAEETSTPEEIVTATPTPKKPVATPTSEGTPEIACVPVKPGDAMEDPDVTIKGRKFKIKLPEVCRASLDKKDKGTSDKYHYRIVIKRMDNGEVIDRIFKKNKKKKLTYSVKLGKGTYEVHYRVVIKRGKIKRNTKWSSYYKFKIK